jgi:hypothetical protein
MHHACKGKSVLIVSQVGGLTEALKQTAAVHYASEGDPIGWIDAEGMLHIGKPED